MEQNTSNKDGNRTRQRDNSSRQMTRTVDRTSIQKIHVPTVNAHNSTSANLRWRRFTQYIKSTREIDLNVKTTDKAIIEEYKLQLETEIGDVFVWALGD